MSKFDLQYLEIPSKKQIFGVAFPMRLEGVGGYVSQNENLRSLKDCVTQLIMTARGARVMRPDYGTDLRASVFEQLNDDVVQKLRTQILDAINKYEPRVIVQRIAVVPDYENNQLNIKLAVTSRDDLLNTEFVEILV
jgi:phage baseplate assembly protein W